MCINWVLGNAKACIRACTCNRQIEQSNMLGSKTESKMRVEAKKNNFNSTQGGCQG